MTDQATVLIVDDEPNIRRSCWRTNPDPKHVSTSHAELQNLTMRMSMRRFTRLTNAFSKKFENHCHSLALHFVFYNWMRKHKAHGKTPAMAAGLTDKPMLMSELVAILDSASKTRSLRGAVDNFPMQTETLPEPAC